MRAPPLASSCQSHLFTLSSLRDGFLLSDTIVVLTPTIFLIRLVYEDLHLFLILMVRW